MCSLPGQEIAQRRLAVPGYVGDPPILLELHELEDDGLPLAQVVERDGGARLASSGVADRDLDALDLPILRINEGVGIELADLAARLSAVLDDERREDGREIAPHRCVIDQLDALCVLALVLVVDLLHE